VKRIYGGNTAFVKTGKMISDPIMPMKASVKAYHQFF
jgi:hypothetical protein